MSVTEKIFKICIVWFFAICALTSFLWVAKHMVADMFPNMVKHADK